METNVFDRTQQNLGSNSGLQEAYSRAGEGCEADNYGRKMSDYLKTARLVKTSLSSMNARLQAVAFAFHWSSTKGCGRFAWRGYIVWVS